MGAERRTFRQLLARSVAGLALVVIVLCASTAGGQGSANSAGQRPGEGVTREAALTADRALPLSFVRNDGQFDRRVRFSARAGGAIVFLARRAVVLSLGKRRGVALRLAFLRANPAPAITGAERSPGRVNYLIGNDPLRWRRNLPTYAEVVYHELWPGVDLVVRGRGGQLKYEFRLRPGADPARIRLRYGGQERLSLDRDGALRVETVLGVLRDGRPVSYQPVGARRTAVASRFSLGEDGAYGFALGAYDRRYPLVIDPGLVYSTFLGGRVDESGNGIAVDEAGSAYVTGTTGSRDFPTTAGAFDRSYSASVYSSEAFVAKLNPAGSALVYSTFLGGASWEQGGGIAVDDAGSAYVAGRTESKNFPTTAGAFDRSYNGGGDAFVAKLNAAGSALAYSTYLGGSGGDRGGGIALDGAGSAYVTGGNSRNFPTTAGAFDRSYNVDDAFVTKLDLIAGPPPPAGSSIEYWKILRGLLITAALATLLMFLYLRGFRGRLIVGRRR